MRRRKRPSPPTDAQPTAVPTDSASPRRPPAAPLAIAPELAKPSRTRRYYRAAVVSGALVLAPTAMAARPEQAPQPTAAHARATALQVGIDQLAERHGQATPRGPTVAPTAAQGPSPLARVGDVELTTPAEEPIVVGFHEAAGHTTEVLEPLAELEDDHNPGQVVEAADAVPTEEETVVLPTRNRGSHASSAVDIAVAADEPILAPVSGEVISVSQYTLYGQHADWIIEIAAAEDPSIRVTIVHVTNPVVEIGDRTVAGETLIAQQPTQFPFASQIDNLTAARVGHATPHVHVEVKRA